MPGPLPLIERMCADHNKAHNTSLTPKEFIELHNTGGISSTARVLGVSRSCLNGAINRYCPDLKSGPSAYSQDVITYKGETGSIRYLALKFGVRPGTVRTRISRGWTTEEALSGKRIGSTRPKRPGVFEFKTENGRITDLARINGLSPDVVFKRIRNGWPVHLALSYPKLKKRDGQGLATPVEYQGITCTITDHAVRLGVVPKLARGRWLNGWPLEMVFSREKQQKSA